MRRVIHREYGGPEVLELVEEPVPAPASGQVLVRVVMAGLNPVDYKSFGDRGTAERFGGSLPSGVGTDFAGVVSAVGPGVTGWSVGDEVYGAARYRAAADFLLAAPEALSRRPAGLPWEQAASIEIAGRTAIAGARRVAAGPGDVLLVGAAAGGVGALACQLAIAAGARVIGTGSQRNFAFLEGLGVVPVEYGDGLVERVRAAAPEGISAVLDFEGRATLEVAQTLEVDPSRVNSVGDRPYAEASGFSTEGRLDTSLDELRDLVRRIASGEVVHRIDRVLPIEDFREAYRYAMGRRLNGKVVLRIGEP